MKGEIIIILASYLLIYSTVYAKSGRKLGPFTKKKDVKSCEEFAKTARFNPYSVLDDVWVVFYYWGPIMPIRTYKFAVPSKRNREVLKKYLNETRVTYPVNWTSPLFVMTEKNTDRSYLLMQMGDRGEFLRYNIFTSKISFKKLAFIAPEDLNFKQIDNGKYLALIICRENVTYIMSRPRDVPKKQVIQDVAAKLGFRGNGGKSYLYQGHRWMPIPEDDDYQLEDFYSYKCKYKKAGPRPLDDPRNQRYTEPRHVNRLRSDDEDDPRSLDERHPDDLRRVNPRTLDDQRPDERHPDDQRPDERHPDDRRRVEKRTLDEQRPDERHSDDQRPDERHPDDQSPDEGHPDEKSGIDFYSKFAC